MTTTNNAERIALALAACEGLTNEELAQRGPGGFKAMIERKRNYANAARHFAAILKQAGKKVQALQQQLIAQQATMATIEQMDKPVADVSAAAALLAGLQAKPSAS